MMKCTSPYTGIPGQAFGCGQCLPCRINRGRIWKTRLLIEAAQHAESAFISLTYSDEHVPKTKTGLMTLKPDDVRLWMYRFRKSVRPVRVRFFCVGEYGDETERPHYHLFMFGIPSCRYGQSRYGEFGRTSCCVICDGVRSSWKLGNVYLGRVEDHSAGYISGYVTKSMTRRDDPRLDGRYPEFSRQSNRPGIGAAGMDAVAKELERFNLSGRMEDVPTALRFGSKVLPLGRYLRRRLRILEGGDGSAPKEVQLARSRELLPLRVIAQNSQKSLKEVIIEMNAGAVANLESKHRLFKPRKRRV